MKIGGLKSWLCLKQSLDWIGLDWIAVRREMLTTTAGKWEMRIVSPRTQKPTQRNASDFHCRRMQATQSLDKGN